MGNNLGQQIYEILTKGNLSEITANSIVKEKCKAIGKTPETITPEDLKKLLPLIMAPVLLFGGERTAQIIKEKIKKLM